MALLQAEQIYVAHFPGIPFITDNNKSFNVREQRGM